MIVAPTGGGVRFVTQPDHAALAGQFADHWGNDAFERPEPSPAVAIAAHVHDDGWWGRDRRPRLGDDGTPVDFTEVPPEPWMRAFGEGIDAAVELDRYAGLLVAMHGVGLRRQRYGLSPSWPESPSAFEDFVDRQEARQRALAEALHDESDGAVTAADLDLLSALHEDDEPATGTESRLWRNYRLLQAWDTLSLSVCTTVDPPSYDEIGPVPTGAGDEPVTLTVDRTGDGSLTVDPYPFDVDPLVASVSTRTVESAVFDGREALVDAYYEARLEVEEVVLRRADG